MTGDLLPRILRDLPGWQVRGEELNGRWSFPDFASALAAAVRVGALAERADHHPDILLGWGRLEVRLSTHSAGRLTEKDIALAEAISTALGNPGATRSGTGFPAPPSPLPPT